MVLVVHTNSRAYATVCLSVVVLYDSEPLNGWTGLWKLVSLKSNLTHFSQNDYSKQ